MATTSSAISRRAVIAAALGISSLGALAQTGNQRRAFNTALVYHPDYLLHDAGLGHPERRERLEAIMAHLKSTALLDELIQIEPSLASERWLETVHSKRYLEYLREAVAAAPTALDRDTSVSKESYRVARLATGGMLSAIDAVVAGQVRNAFVAARPPGHHALTERAMGFCLINHVAIAARYAQQRHGLMRVLIVDWDVHHGNGTQDTFYRDSSVLYFSTHQSPYYPGTGDESERGADAGLGTTVNVPLPAGSGDAVAIDAFERVLVPAADAFRPDLVLVTAGFDAHRDDPLAALGLTAPGYAELTRIVMEIAARHAGGRLVSLLEGGYDLDALSRSVEAHLRTLLAATTNRR